MQALLPVKQLLKACLMLQDFSWVIGTSFCIALTVLQFMLPDATWQQHDLKQYDKVAYTVFLS